MLEANLAGIWNKTREALSNEDFCFLARRECFLSTGIYGYISSIKKHSQRRQGAKRLLSSAS